MKMVACQAMEYVYEGVSEGHGSNEQPPTGLHLLCTSIRWEVQDKGHKAQEYNYKGVFFFTVTVRARTCP